MSKNAGTRRVRRATADGKRQLVEITAKEWRRQQSDARKRQRTDQADRKRRLRMAELEAIERLHAPLLAERRRQQRTADNAYVGALEREFPDLLRGDETAREEAKTFEKAINGLFGGLE